MLASKAETYNLDTVGNSLASVKSSLAQPAPPPFTSESQKIEGLAARNLSFCILRRFN